MKLLTELSEKVGSSDFEAGYVFADASIRRLTPLECERLQAFPDILYRCFGPQKLQYRPNYTTRLEAINYH